MDQTLKLWDITIKEQSISQDHLQEWMSWIKAQKSLVLLDTCHSGLYVKS